MPSAAFGPPNVSCWAFARGLAIIETSGVGEGAFDHDRAYPIGSHPRTKTVPVSTGRRSGSMRLPWGFRRRRVRTRVVRTRVAVTRCSEKRRRRLSPSRRIARADVRMGASVRKARSHGSSPSPVHGRRDPRRRSWRLGAPKPSPNPRRLWASGGMRTQGQTAIVVPAADTTAVANGAEFGVGSAGPATAAAKPRRPLFARKGAIAVVLMTGVAAAAIMVLNWPQPSHPQAMVEPGMLADQPTKVMAPSAALATVPPREEPNVAGERPQVHETRRDEVQEVLSFKGPQATASPPAASPSPTPSPVGASVTVAKPAVPTPDPAVAAGPTLTVSAPVSPPASLSPVAGSKAEKVASLPPPASAPAFVTSVAPAPAQGAEAPGLGEAAKIESRLGELEAAIKERSNATVTRADVDKAETLTSDQIARLAAIVTRLTGQVKDLQDQVRTMSAGSEAKLADLTRRVSLSESKSAVAAAERANVSQASAEGSAATASARVEGQAQGVRMKVAGVDQKRKLPHSGRLPWSCDAERNRRRPRRPAGRDRDRNGSAGLRQGA